MDYIWAGLRKLGVVSASADAAAQCGPEFPEVGLLNDQQAGPWRI
jgi:hypothetical protein